MSDPGTIHKLTKYAPKEFESKIAPMIIKACGLPDNAPVKRLVLTLDTDEIPEIELHMHLIKDKSKEES